MIYGPYSLISSAVAAELGTHPSLQGSSKNLFMVTAIIDGTGSIGASIGPFITGAIEGLENGLTWTFVMLMCANVCALLVSISNDWNYKVTTENKSCFSSYQDFFTKR